MARRHYLRLFLADAGPILQATIQAVTTNNFNLLERGLHIERGHCWRLLLLCWSYRLLSCDY